MSFFSSKSSSANASAQNFYPITSYKTGFGALSDKDTAWACTNNRGFQTETQVWYSVLEDGSHLMVQVIWTYLGLFLVPATSQMTFKIYNPKTRQATWRSLNASSFKPNGRGCKSDQFEIKHSGSPTGEEAYSITASLDKTVQLTVTFSRPADAPGFKLGDGPDGGFSTFGKEREDGKRDGMVVHRFLPMMTSSGSIVVDGAVVDAKGDAMFVHAIQGMRPDSIASRWNFAFFTTGGGKPQSSLGDVRAVQMELETTDSYGPKGAKSGRTKVNIGTVYTSQHKPLVVVGQTHCPTADGFPVASKDVSSAQHFGATKDKDTGYLGPGGIEFKWEGEQIGGGGRASAVVRVDKLGIIKGEGGLIDKIDVLAEIPYVIRKGLAAVTGTKPYIYQYHNAATLNVTLGGETTPVEGWLFNEASFVSE